MIYGEHLSAEEVPMKCGCGVTATVEVRNKLGSSCGWFCRSCAEKLRGELRRQEKIVRAIVRRRVP